MSATPEDTAMSLGTAEKVWIKRAVDTYHPDVILFSLISIHDYPFLFQDTVLKIKDDYSELKDYIENLTQDKKEDIFKKLDHYLDSLPSNARFQKLDRIKSWCNTWYFFNMTSDIATEHSDDFACIISKVKTTKHLLNKYIKVKGQYCGSLSSSQVNMLFDEVLNFVSGLKPDEQQAFYEDFLKNRSI